MEIVMSVPISWDLEDLEAGPEWRGAVETLDEGKLTGWLISTDYFLKPAAVDVYFCGEKIGSSLTSLPRRDLSEHFGLPLKAGFEFDLRSVTPEAARDILLLVKKNGTDVRPGSYWFEVRVAGTELLVPFLSPAERAVDPRVIVEYVARASQRFVSDSERIRLRDQYLDGVGAAADIPVSVLAYYLPQFHPFKENNEWWGKGFTEWTNVARAKSYFADHYQPHLPADLGFYDLRVDQTHRDQIELAKKYGLTGFCYYYYWFSGETLMTMPIDRHLEQDFDFDFCLCWANESWSRRWDGSESDVLMAQRHSFDSDGEFINSCIKYFKSERYIKINGAPLLQVYRVELMENALETIACWREVVKKQGFPDLHVCMVESFGLTDPSVYGCDSSCQFPPHGVVASEVNNKIDDLDPQFSGRIYDYEDVVRGEIARPSSPHVRFRTAMPSWDNTSRKGLSGNIFHNSSPEMFEAWLTYLIDDAKKRLPPGKRFVFINAWNEWAEGAHLEPDRRLGHDNLKSVRNALSLKGAAIGPIQAKSEADDDFHLTVRYLENLLTSNRALTQLLAASETRRDILKFVAIPSDWFDIADSNSSKFNIEVINARHARRGSLAIVNNNDGLSMSGWVLAEDDPNGPVMVALRPDGVDEETRYVVELTTRFSRADVVKALGLELTIENCGFQMNADVKSVPRGVYEIEFLLPHQKAPRSVHVISTSFFVAIGE